MRRHRQGLLSSFIFLLLLTTVVRAHSMYQSDVMLDFVGKEVHAELQVPLERMGAVFGKPIGLQTLAREKASLTAYVLSRFQARTPDGHAFQTRLQAPLQITVVDGAPYLV